MAGGDVVARDNVVGAGNVAYADNRTRTNERTPEGANVRFAAKRTYADFGWRDLKCASVSVACFAFKTHVVPFASGERV